MPRNQCLPCTLIVNALNFCNDDRFYQQHAKLQRGTGQEAKRAHPRGSVRTTRAFESAWAAFQDSNLCGDGGHDTPLQLFDSRKPTEKARVEFPCGVGVGLNGKPMTKRGVLWPADAEQRLETQWAHRCFEGTDHYATLPTRHLAVQAQLAGDAGELEFSSDLRATCTSVNTMHAATTRCAVTREMLRNTEGVVLGNEGGDVLKRKACAEKIIGTKSNPVPLDEANGFKVKKDLCNALVKMRSAAGIIEVDRTTCGTNGEFFIRMPKATPSQQGKTLTHLGRAFVVEEITDEVATALSHPFCVNHVAAAGAVNFEQKWQDGQLCDASGSTTTTTSDTTTAAANEDTNSAADASMLAAVLNLP